ncbi:16214_t:CDS:2, partial [Entrophospora sp. SA101]
MVTYSLSYGKDLSRYKVLYIVWIIFIILIFVNYEYLFNLKNLKFSKYIKFNNNNNHESECEEDSSGNQRTKMTIIKCLGDEKCNILPELTLDEFNDKVQRGLIKFHLKHYNFNNNNSKLSMHLIYANKSVDDSIVNLKDCYYHSLNNNNTNDNTNIDDVLIRKSGLEGKVDKDILENWFKNTIINEKEIEQKVGRGWESGKETFTGDLSKNPLDNYNNDSSFGLQSSSSSLSISSIPSLSSPSLAAAVEASSSVQPTATATATSSNFLKQSSFSLNRKIHKPPPRLNLVTDIYNCNNDNDNNLQKVQMEGRFDSISSRPN